MSDDSCMSDDITVYLAERAILEEVAESIDQLAAQARDCETLAPAVKDMLDIAWYFAEEALRDTGLASCGHNPRCKDRGQLWDHQAKTYGPCPCCQHFDELALRARRLRGAL